MTEFRTDHINEKYYTKYPAPSAHQFNKNNYHFSDSDERWYMVAIKSSDPSRNKRFQTTSSSSSSTSRPKECIHNGYGDEITLDVRFRMNDGSDKFKRDHIGKSIDIMERKGGERHTINLKSIDIPSNRMTGTIVVTGLDVNYCNELLNYDPATTK
jgi:hypothetical protein